MTATAASDQDAILEHVHGLFRAFLRRDEAAIRAGHTSDWHGFQIRSTSLVRGIDDYMDAARDLVRNLKATRYEMLDTEVKVCGDFAWVVYLARDFIADEAGERTVLLRALDVYRRDEDGWNQCASNICALPEPK